MKFKNKKKKKNSRSYTLKGTVDHVNKKYAFIEIDEFSEDIKIRSRFLKGAIHGDKVEVKVFHHLSRNNLEGELGRQPTNEEMADALDMTVAKYDKMLRLTRRSISFRTGTVSLCRLKGCKVTVCQTLKMIKLSKSQTWATHIWFDTSQAVESFSKPPTLTACNFSDI